MNTEIEIGLSDGFGNIACSNVINYRVPSGIAMLNGARYEINYDYELNIKLLTREYNKLTYYFDKYGGNYKEVIQKKWDMRKLNRKLKNKLPLKNIINKKGKI